MGFREKGQFTRLCPVGYVCTDGTGLGQAYRQVQRERAPQGVNCCIVAAGAHRQLPPLCKTHISILRVTSCTFLLVYISRPLTYVSSTRVHLYSFAHSCLRAFFAASRSMRSLGNVDLDIMTCSVENQVFLYSQAFRGVMSFCFRNSFPSKSCFFPHYSVSGGLPHCLPACPRCGLSLGIPRYGLGNSNVQ